MEITLNNVETLDQLMDIIATKHPSVEMHRNHLSLLYQGVELTVEPKKNRIYDVNKDVPILKDLLLGIVILAALYVLAALIYPPLLAQQSAIPIVGAGIWASVVGFFNRKAKPAIENFCQELTDMCK